MRLINVRTLKLETFFDNSVPPYAILSHTWKDDEELSFRDIEEGRINKPGIGSIKLQKCCEQTKKDGLAYAWIDTCCIDKTDSVELGEAINSMFRWYKKAKICYAYLLDVPMNDNPRNPDSAFQNSRWFKRGWTLQELLAPQRLQFYDSDWRFLGSKGDLCLVVESITRISRQFLLGIGDLRNASVAQRMSWAAQRETTRQEDSAYCLLGIFGVTIPMIYGEGGEQAFFRVQEQIMRTTRDDSILAWGLSLTEPISSYANNVKPGKILAAAPSDFANCEHIVSREQSSSPMHSLDMSGGSLRVYLPLLTTIGGEIIGLLKCGVEHNVQQIVGVPLCNATSMSTDEFIRPRGSRSVLLPIDAANTLPKLIHIKNDSHSEKTINKNEWYWLYSSGFSENNLDLIDVAPRSCWDEERDLIISTIETDAEATHRTLARFRYKDDKSYDFVVILEIQQMESRVIPYCGVMICSRDTSLENLTENFRYMSQGVPGRRSASNGMLNLHVALESGAQQPIILIKPFVTSDPPETTYNATHKLQKMDFRLDFARLMASQAETDTKSEKLEQMVKDESNRLDDLKKELSEVEDELRKLMERKRTLLEAGEEQMTRLNKEHSHIKKSQVVMSEHRSFMNHRWHVEYSRGGDKAEALDYCTLLKWAATHGHEALVNELSNINGTDFNIVLDSIDGKTALSHAAENGHHDVVRMLLEKGADIMVTSKEGWKPLDLAAAKGHVKVAKLLLEIKAEGSEATTYRWTPLISASKHGHLEVVKLLLDNGALDTGIDAILARYVGGTSLNEASENGHLEVVKLLVEEGANIATTNYRGCTALNLASENGHLEVVNLLLEMGANISTANDTGWTPLNLASENGHTGVVKLLLKNGADVTVASRSGWTPLISASRNGYSEVVKLLLDSGADVAAKNCFEWTPLNSASSNGHVEVVKLLLERGADFTDANFKGWTPLASASNNGHFEVVKLLLEKGADIGVANYQGWTPLKLASSNGHANVVALLLEKGADIDESGVEGWTPLTLAANNGHVEVVNLLHRNGANFSLAKEHGEEKAPKLVFRPSGQSNPPSASFIAPVTLTRTPPRLPAYLRKQTDSGKSNKILDRFGF